MLIQPGQFRTKTVRPSMTDFQVESETKNQLIKESSSLVPDAGKITEQIMKFELSPYDSAEVKSKANSILSDYIEKYRNNPYYAFSREAINQTQELQNIVNNPDNTRMSELYKQSKEEFKNLRDKELLSLTAYEKGHIKVIDKENQELKWVPVDEYNPDRHQQLTVGDDYSISTTRTGFRNSDRPYTYNMRKLADVKNTIAGYFNGLGTSEVETLVGDLTRTSKNNKFQLEKAIDAVLSSAGLSEADRNTLAAEQISMRGGAKVSSQDIYNGIASLVSNIAQSKFTTSTDTKVNPEFTVAHQREIASKTGLTPVNVVQQTLSGFGSKKYLPISLNGITSTVEATVVPEAFWSGSQIVENSDKIKKLNTNLTSLKGGTFGNGFYTNEAKIVNQKTGQLETVNLDSAEDNVVFDKNNSNIIPMTYVVVEGKTSFRPGMTAQQAFDKEYARLIQAGVPSDKIDDNMLSAGTKSFLKSKIAINKPSLTSTYDNEGHEKLMSQFSQYGYNPSSGKDVDQLWNSNVTPEVKGQNYFDDYYYTDVFVPLDTDNLGVYGNAQMQKQLSDISQQNQSNPTITPSSKAEAQSKFKTRNDLSNPFIKR